MTPSDEILARFEEDIISATTHAGDYGVPQADIMRPYLRLIPEPTLRYRVVRLERQNKIRIRDVGGRKLLLPAEVQE